MFVFSPFWWTLNLLLSKSSTICMLPLNSAPVFSFNSMSSTAFTTRSFLKHVLLSAFRTSELISPVALLQSLLTCSPSFSAQPLNVDYSKRILRPSLFGYSLPKGNLVQVFGFQYIANMLKTVKSWPGWTEPHLPWPLPALKSSSSLSYSPRKDSLPWPLVS